MCVRLSHLTSIRQREFIGRKRKGNHTVVKQHKNYIVSLRWGVGEVTGQQKQQQQQKIELYTHQ